MGRKRKIPIADEEKENTVATSRQGSVGGGVAASNSLMLHGPMYTIMSNVQLNETNHKKYIKELKQLYGKMDHDAFMFTFIKMIKTAMVADEGNEYADTTLLFCSKFVSSYDGDDTHPLLIDMCKWLLTTISRNPHIRFRICQFVNMILKALGQEAALDDAICDRIMEYMLHRLHDTSPNVRVQAILAMQRLQVPDNPDDPVLRAYQFHLCSDPSSRVRQAVITCMGRNYHTIPYILDRLWDIDEKVRRHTYLHMSSYPVRSYKVSQRLTLLQQGLNDRSEAVRKVVVTILLQQWIESYQKEIIALISALKLDSSESDIDRFRKVAKQTLKEIFKRQNKEDLLACVPLEEDSEMHRCVPYEKLSMEIAIYWQCLTEFLQSEMAEEFDLIVPELSTFCTYVEKFCQSQKPDMDKFELMEFQYKLLSLMEILYTFDLGDEIGRGNLQRLLAYLLKTFRLDEKVIEVIVRCAENLITDQNARIQLFVEIIQDISGLNSKQNDLLHDRTLISELLASSSNADLNLKLSSLKVKILDLEEQEMNFVQRKDYMRAQQITEEKHLTTEEYTNLLQPLLESHPNAEMLKRPLHLGKMLKPESILKSLQIVFYMVVSPKVRSLNPSILNLYNNFICRHLASNQIAIRDWALKCGTACSMLYEALAKDVFEELYAQFFKNHNIRIWETSITCIFELLDRYGLDNFAKQEEQSKSKKSGRQLYNTLEFLDSEDDSNVLNAGQGVDVIYMMSHFLDTCDDTCIISAIIIGFCRLILRGYIKSSDIIEKLLLRYFNPSTDSNINQILGVFLENLIQRKKHGLLQPCLLPMVLTVLGAPYENPLHDIRPETITRFIIDSTRQESSKITDGYIHNKIALTFLQDMLNNLTNKELCKLLAKELITLELNLTQNEQLKRELKECADKLIKADFDPKTIKHIIDFKDLVDGNYNPTRKPAANHSEGEEDTNDETENDANNDDDSATVTTARTKMSVSEAVGEPSQQPPQQPLPDIIVTATESITPSSEEVPEPAVETTTAEADPIETPATVAQTSESAASAISDGAIITKDISPSSRVPTTYGRENRVGHRYLRKSLNSTRGQSDTEVGDGPRRSPKIRIEARIDSDKKSEEPSREERQVRNTRVRRNLRYVEKNMEAEGKEVIEHAKDGAKARNNRRANLPAVVVDAEPEVNTSPKQKSNASSKVSTVQEQTTVTLNTSSPGKRRSKESTNVPNNDEPLEKSKEPNREQRKEKPKDKIKTRAREPEQQQVKVTPAKATRLLVRASARNAAKHTDADELNSPDVIPASPTAALSPRTIVRRQRRAGGGDISVRNLTESTSRATRSHSAQQAANKDSETSTDSEGEVRTDAITAALTKVSSLPRTGLKRTHHSTPEPEPEMAGKVTVAAVIASPRLNSPLLKRLRSESPTKRQRGVTRRTRSSTSTPMLPSDAEGGDRGNEFSKKKMHQKRGRGRPRTRSEASAAPKANSKTTRRSAGVKVSELNKRAFSVTRSRSATSARSATRTPSITQSDAAAQRTRSATRTAAVAGKRTRSATRTVIATRRAGAVTGTRSATRADSKVRTKSASRSTVQAVAKKDDPAPTHPPKSTRNIIPLTRSHSATRAPTPSVTDKGERDNSNSATHGKRRRSNANKVVVVKSPQPTGMMTRRRLSMNDGDEASGKSVTGGNNSEAVEVAQRMSANATKVQHGQPSRIPVRASSSNLATMMKTRHGTRIPSTLALAPNPIESNSSSGSGGSSTEETIKTLGAAMLRRRALATKMTRINLAQRSKGNPVPMELARPTRVRTPVKKVPTTSKLRPKRLYKRD